MTTATSGVSSVMVVMSSVSAVSPTVAAVLRRWLSVVWMVEMRAASTTSASLSQNRHTTVAFSVLPVVGSMKSSAAAADRNTNIRVDNSGHQTNNEVTHKLF